MFNFRIIIYTFNEYVIKKFTPSPVKPVAPSRKMILRLRLRWANDMAKPFSQLMVNRCFFAVDVNHSKLAEMRVIEM